MRQRRCVSKCWNIGGIQLDIGLTAPLDCVIIVNMYSESPVPYRVPYVSYPSTTMSTTTVRGFQYKVLDCFLPTCTSAAPSTLPTYFLHCAGSANELSTYLMRLNEVILLLSARPPTRERRHTSLNCILPWVDSIAKTRLSAAFVILTEMCRCQTIIKKVSSAIETVLHECLTRFKFV